MPELKVKETLIHSVRLEGETIETLFKVFDGDQSLKGFVMVNVFKDNELDSFYSNLRLFKSKEGNYFISEPSEKYKNKDGEDKYRKMYLIPQSLKNTILESFHYAEVASPEDIKEYYNK